MCVKILTLASKNLAPPCLCETLSASRSVLCLSLVAESCFSRAASQVHDVHGVGGGRDSRRDRTARARPQGEKMGSVRPARGPGSVGESGVWAWSLGVTGGVPWVRVGPKVGRRCGTGGFVFQWVQG